LGRLDTFPCSNVASVNLINNPNEENEISGIESKGQYSIQVVSLLFIIIIPIMNCGQTEEYFPMPEIEYKLVVVDSIGVEFGEEEYMFAQPQDPTLSSDGRIFVLDALKHTVMVYSPEGEFLDSIGREGEGPGEFNNPSGVEILPDGSVLIESMDKYALFDSTFSFVDQYVTTGFSPLSIRQILDDGSFIGTKFILSVGENGPVTTRILGKFELFEEDPSVTFYSDENTWDISGDPGVFDFTRNREEGLIYCASTDGHVFYARSSINELYIHCCSSDGSEYMIIEDENIHRVRKTQEELDAEMQSYLSAFRSIGSRTGRSFDDLEIILDPYKRIIKEMFVDSQERLWVRIGIYPGTVYRVYDFDGNILFHAEVDYPGNQLDLNNWAINGDENGILAVNESMEEYQRVYILEMRPVE
jgi:hypothetical protein